MRKRLQNRISENRLTLPLVAMYASVIWLVCGLIENQWWFQFACFAISSYLMVELNNRNALIRIYSKMVSCAFLVLSVAACFMFADIKEGVTGLLMIAAYILLFRTYQDKSAAGNTYYTFLCLGLASMAHVHSLYFVPAYWLLMLFFMQTMSMRTFCASLLGLLTPYWFASAYFIFYSDFITPLNHFAEIFHFPGLLNLSILSMQQVIVFIFINILLITGSIHFMNTSYNDKIRTRMMYYSFITMGFLSALYLLLQPQHYELAVRMMIINTSPLIGHFVALTNTRITNIAFCTIIITALSITIFNIWTL